MSHQKKPEPQNHDRNKNKFNSVEAEFREILSMLKLTVVFYGKSGLNICQSPFLNFSASKLENFAELKQEVKRLFAFVNDRGIWLARTSA